MSSPIPLPVIWRSPVGSGYAVPNRPPVVASGTVTVRCGQDLVRLAAGDGSPVWSATLPPRSGNGTFLIRHAGLTLTDVVRHPERLGSVVATDEDGEPAWRADLPGILAPRGAAIVGDQLSVVVTDPAEGVVVHLLDTRTGEPAGRIPLPWGADELIPWHGGFLVRSQASNGVGLYTMDFDGVAREISAKPVWRMSIKDDLVVTSTGAAPGTPGELRMRGGEELREVWSAPAVVETPIRSGENVYAMDGAALVARQAGDGTERWRTQPLEEAVLTLDVEASVVFCGYLGGSLLRHRDGGGPLGKVTGFHSPPAAESDRLYLVADGAAMCLRAPD